MLNSGNKVHRENTTTSSDMPQLPQYLPLDPITLEIQKCSSSGELRKVLGVPLTGVLRDHSLYVPQLKTTAPLASGELKHFKENVQNASRKARDRAKMLKESIVKLDKYEEALNSKKRKKNETNQRYGGVRTGKLGSQNPKIPKHIISHGPGDKSEDVMMINDVQQSKIDRDIGNSTTIGNVRIKEKTRRLLAGGEGLDQKVKKKRSVGAVYNREISCDAENKHDSHPKLSTNTKFQSLDAQGVRLKSRPGVSGIRHRNNQKSATLTRESMAAPNLRAMAKANDRSNTQEELQADSHNPNVKGKFSRTSCPSISMELDTSVIHPPSGACSGTSMQPMTRWIGQRPQKSSRSRRAIALPPVSGKYEVLDTSQGSPTSDSFVQTITSDHACTRVDNVQEFTKESNLTSTMCQLSKSAGSGENETREKEKICNRSEQTAQSSGSSMFRMRRNRTNGSGYDVEELGKAQADSSSREPGVPSIMEKLENLPLTKSQQSTKPSDKGRSKSGRPPIIKQGHRYQTHVGQKSHSPTDLTGIIEDDREELILAANSACNASSLACSGPFWKKLEPLFASVSADNVSYLRQQVNFVESCADLLQNQECNADDYILGVTRSSGKTGLDHVMKVSPGALSETSSMRRLEKTTPLYQRVLSALIKEDEAGEPSRFGDICNMPLQYASDDSFCGSCNPIDVELRERDRMDSEVESEVDLQNQKVYMDRISCDKSVTVTSNSKRNLDMSSSLQTTGVWHGDDDCSHSEITYNNEICSCDIGQVQAADSDHLAFSSTEVQHQLMSLENRLLMELHSIGLYPETLPDLLDGDEAINEDIIELKNRLHQQMEWKMKTLGKIEKALENEQDKQKQKMEQAALDQLIEIAYRKQLACRRSNASKNAARRGSKQVVLAFLKRTLMRCKRYEETGNICFKDLPLQSSLSSPIVVAADAKSSDCLGSAAASNKCNKPLQVEAQKSGMSHGDVSIPSEGHESHGDNLDGRLLESIEGVISSSELMSSVKESLYNKERREVATKDAIGDSRVLTLGGTKRKRSGTDKHNRRDHTKSNAISIANQLLVENCQNGLKQKDNRAKNQSRLTEAVESMHLPTNQLSQTVVNPRNSIELEGKRTGNINSKDTELSSVPGNFSLPVLDTMDELDPANGLDGHQDLGSWLTFDDDGLPEHDSLGLAIPMDDLSEILGMNM